MIALENNGVEQRIQQNRYHHGHERMGAVGIFGTIEPAGRYDIPDDETQVSETENGAAFIFYFGKFGDFVLHHQKRNKRKKDKEGNAVRRPGNA